jgi:adenylosuccinate synthase
LDHAVRLNSLSEIAVTKLDVLSAFETIKVCVGYRDGDDLYDHVPYHQSVLHRVQPVYREMPGWCSDISQVRSVSDLPQGARAYLDAIAEHTGVPVSYAGVGPGREQYVRLAQ